MLKEDYDALSTNRVAEQAGVSVGSLYQYFPGKEALVRSLIEHWAGKVLERMKLVVRSVQGASLEITLERLVHEVLELYREHPKLYRAFAQQAQRLGAMDAMEQLNRRAAEMLAELLEAHAEVEVDGLELATHVVVTSVTLLADHALVYREDLLRSSRFERHLVRLVLGYLAPSKLARGSSRPVEGEPR